LVEKPMADLRRRFGSLTTKVIECPQDIDVPTTDGSPRIAPVPLDNMGVAKTMVGYNEWKPQLGTERGRS